MAKKNILESFGKTVGKSFGKTAAAAVSVSSSTKSSSNNNQSSYTNKIKELETANQSLTTANQSLTNSNQSLTSTNEILKTNITGLTYNLGNEQTKNEYLDDQLYGNLTTLVAIQEGEEIAGFANIEPFVEGVSNITPKEREMAVNLEKVTKENELLEKQIQENSNKFTADDSKYFYKTKQYDYQFNLNRVFNFFYYILVTILAVVLGFYDRTIHLYVKAGIIFVLLFYPYLIVYLEYLIYIVSKYVYSIFYNIPFDMQNDYWFIISSS